jgi:hypothetical protein
MSFDPLKPATGSRLSSEEMRAQLNGLKALIDAVPAGPPGPQGPAFASIQIASVTTGTPGSPAGAQVAVFGNNVELSFTIPAGEQGASGVTSSDVTNAIANEISGTARNPNTVAMLGISVSDPPTQTELQEVVAKINELIGALTR